MVELQRMTGMRPSEVVAMTSGEVDRSGAVWEYRPRRHKTAHRGVTRVVMIGPKAQEVLAPWLKDDPAAYCFPPREAVAARNAARRRARKTPMTPSQLRRRPKRDPKRAPGPHYSRNAYREAVARACRKAGVPVWGPNRLRHALATKVTREFDLAAAQVVLGHRSIRTTETYVKPSPERAGAVMGEIG
jgi:integrase